MKERLFCSSLCSVFTIFLNFVCACVSGRFSECAIEYSIRIDVLSNTLYQDVHISELSFYHEIMASEL